MQTTFKVYNDFLSKEACALLIKTAYPKLNKLQVLHEKDGESYNSARVAHGVWLKPEDCEIIQPIREQVALLSELPIENQEEIHVVQYKVGGKYDPHHDYFPPDKKYFMNTMQSGGQRVQSWIIYLNDDYEGGETDFPEENITIVPETGMLAGWNNVIPPKKLNTKSLHAGLPVIKGEKWIAVIWIREFSRHEKIKPDPNEWEFI